MKKKNKTLKRSGTRDLKKKIISAMLTAVIVLGLIPQNSIFAPLTAHAAQFLPIILKYAAGAPIRIPIGGVNTAGGTHVYYNWGISIDGTPISVVNGTSQEGFSIQFSYGDNREHIVTISPAGTAAYGWAKAFGNTDKDRTAAPEIGIKEVIQDPDEAFMAGENNVGNYFRFQQYYKCTKLTTVLPEETLPSGVTTIGDHFRDGQYRSCTLLTAPGAEALPDNITSIGTHFRYRQYLDCKSLKVAAADAMQDGVRSIGNYFRAYQYSNCISLKTAAAEALPHNTNFKTIGGSFRYSQYDGCTTLKTAAAEVLPDTITTIWEYFRGYQYSRCTLLTLPAAETLSNSLTMIDKYFRAYQYQNCTSLRAAANEWMPNSLTDIGTYFRYCQYYYCLTMAFAGTEAMSNKLVNMGEHFRDQQYSTCVSLKASATEYLPNGLKYISGYFRNQQYYIGASITRTGAECLPNSVQSVGGYFRNKQYNFCTSLYNLTPEVMPASVTYVGPYFRAEQYAVCEYRIHTTDFLEPPTLTTKGANYRYQQYWDNVRKGTIVVQKSGEDIALAELGDVLSFDADLLFRFGAKNPPNYGSTDLWRIEWLRNGAPIPLATDATYTVADADLGADISVRLTSQVSEVIYNDNGPIDSNAIPVPVYTVTFDPGQNGAISGTASADVARRRKLSSLPTVTADQTHVFIGWESGETGGLYSAAALLALPIVKPMTFTALYALASDATVIFDYAGGDVSGVTSSYQSGTPTTTFSIPEPTRFGYSLKGWVPTLTDVTGNGEGVFGAARSITSYEAQWEPSIVTMTFDPGAINGTPVGNPVTRGAVYGTSLGAPNLPTPTPGPNYTLIGWSDGTNFYNSAAVASLTITTPVAFTAQYTEAANATVVFNYGGGTDGSGAGYSIVSGLTNTSLLPFIPTGLTRIGHARSGANGGWDTPVPSVFGTAGSTTTYTAQWAMSNIGVIFSQGANGMIMPDPSIVRVSYGDSMGMANIPDVAPNMNFEFIGWESSTGTLYTSQAVAALPITSTMIFTAIYADVANGTVIFDYNGGTDGDAGYKILSDLPGTRYEVPNPTRMGYKFTGWDRNPSGYFGAAKTRETYAAQWVPGVTHDVRINTKLGTAAATLYDTVQYPSGEDAEVYPPYAAGYLLSGYIIDGGSETAISVGFTGALFAAIDADHEVTFVYTPESSYISNKFTTITVVGKTNDAAGAALYSYVKSVPKDTTASKVIGDNEVFDLTPTWALKSGERTKQTFAPAANRTVEFYYESNTTNVTVYAKQYGTPNNVTLPIVLPNVPLGSIFSYGSLSIHGYQLVDSVTGANTQPYTGTINSVSASANSLTFYYKAAIGNQLVIYKDKESGEELGRDMISIPVNTPTDVTVPAIQYYTTTETARNVTWDGMANIGDIVYEYTRNKAAIRLEAWDCVTNLSIGKNYTVTNKRVLENYDYSGDIPSLTALVTPMGYSPAPHGSTIVNVEPSGSTVKIWYAPAENGTVPVELRLGSISGALIQAYNLPAATGETVTLSDPQIPDLTSLGFAYKPQGSILTATEGGGDVIILIYEDIRRAVTVKNDVDTTEVNENVPDGTARIISPPYKAGFVATKYSTDGGATKVPIDSSFTGFGATVSSDLEIIFYYISASMSEYVTLTVNGMAGTQMLFSYPTLIEKNTDTPIDATGVPGYSLDRTRGENWSEDAENAGVFGRRIFNLSADGSHTFYFTRNTATVLVDVIDQATGATIVGQSVQSLVGDVGGTITVNAPVIPDYELVSWESSAKTHLVINGLNELSFTYKKTSGNILIKAVEQGNTDNILGMWSDTAEIGKIYTALPRDFTGWIKPGTAAQTTAAAGQNIVILEYTKDMRMITVHYYEKGTTTKVASDMTIQAQLGETLTVTADPTDLREGYVINGSTYFRHMAAEGANEVVFEYTPVVSEKPVVNKKPGLKILVTVAATGAAQAGAAVKVTAQGAVANTYTADGAGQVEVPNAALGAYSVEASYSGYDIAKGAATLSEEDPDQILLLPLGKTVSVSAPPAGGGSSFVVSSGGGGGGGDSLAAATLKIRCIDEKGTEIFLQALTTVVGKTETIKAPPIKGYKLAEGEKESQSVAIKSGENVVTFKYAVDGAALAQMGKATGATGSAIGAAGDTSVVSGAMGAGSAVGAGNRVADFLETEDHIKYINGYPDGMVRPESSITRAEVAMIFYRLTKDAGKNAPAGNSFSDVKENAWFAQAVGYLTKKGILKGYNEAGAVNFKPNQSITRAEFAAMAMRFDTGSNVNMNPFSDLTASNWAYNDILSAYDKGWIGGYPDGTVKPGSSITRTEVVTIVNKMLNRRIHKEDVPGELLNVYPDLSTGYWGFTAVTEATFAHDPKRKDDGFELWSKYVR